MASIENIDKVHDIITKASAGIVDVLIDDFKPADISSLRGPLSRLLEINMQDAFTQTLNEVIDTLEA